MRRMPSPGLTQFFTQFRIVASSPARTSPGNSDFLLLSREVVMRCVVTTHTTLPDSRCRSFAAPTCRRSAAGSNSGVLDASL
eukprot:CAMPEP_0170636226 /NCGR_PEP_ID=MMETSP0224-20130122/37668_1 /TAXON_ID=285029 /ORGANISM="Togula jolla, Strain CCCM 725" /LENGTH=81 /DNA_ID=CAMNT_0010965831 /DNA_START=210 /DNA_END=452 /DNA_ORIENTATION=+